MPLLLVALVGMTDLDESGLLKHERKWMKEDEIWIKIAFDTDQPLKIVTSLLKNVKNNLPNFHQNIHPKSRQS
jgi:hypothetical protein